jgi:uncharacterized protein YdiU (UPF0061 family)
MTANWKFDNTYTRLPEKFFARVDPTAVRAPKMAVFNRELATSLGLDADLLASESGAALLSGNAIPQGAEPIAQAYAGHQFGHFTMLGDGRALLLGEHVSPNGERVDIQLKGSGPTPFSRRGDGRAALGPMLREYIISEAMFALKIPTTRSLAVVTTGEPVFRETSLPGAILTRVASSHIRVGTFEYAAALGDPDALKALAEYTLARHYPKLQSKAEPYLEFLKAVIDRQASLIAQWMHVGFIHGVMNTDNMALSGESIDYGPCAFMNGFSEATVFSSIDRNGRYAYGNQPEIAVWNLTRFAETLLPLLSSDINHALEKARAAIATFADSFKHHWTTGIRAKLGLGSEAPDEFSLVEKLFALMERHQADYTTTFRALSSDPLPDSRLFRDADFKDWYNQWQSKRPSLEEMRLQNPAVIPRNHRVEEALSAAVEREDYSIFHRLLTALKNPFEVSPENAEFLAPPPSEDPNVRTYCGT